ncbi:hypothetical protein RIF29_41235 [Crotalaria pallida]|uniref:FRIGIDA-like protein n=1 Tax=Crotalaria pallida TaxID=3830 RepID=A0AAN9E7M7_CROPI
MSSSLKTISEALNLIDSKKHNLKKAFDDLQSQSSLSFSNSLLLSWPHIDSHFSSIQSSLTHRFHLLQTLTPSPPTPNDPSSCVSTPSILPTHEFVLLFQNMDGKAFINYVNAHPKHRLQFQAELPGALLYAPNPAEMALESLEGYYHHLYNTNNNELKERELRFLKKICMILLRQLRVLKPSMSSETRDRALKMAKEWKEKMSVDNVNALGALAFFHFVTAYGLVTEIGIDDLVEYAVMSVVVVDNAEFPELRHMTGFADRVPYIIRKLVERGKHILAVNYVFEYDLADKISPVPILKAFVDESKELSKRLSEERKSPSDIIAREMQAIREVIEIVENHKLEFEYPLTSLKQRIDELKRQKSLNKLLRKQQKQPAPASDAAKPPQHQQQQQQFQKRKKQKVEQQQGGTKLTQTLAPVGPAPAPNNVNNGNLATHQYHQHCGFSSGVLTQHPNPYTSSPTMPLGMVSPTQIVRPLVGPYGLGGSNLNSSMLHVPSSYYGGGHSAYTHGGVGLQHYYQGSH